MLTSYVLQYKLVGFNLPVADNWLVALRFHVVFLMNARKWEPLTDFSRIDRRYDLIVTKKSVDLSHQRYKIRNCHWKLFFAFPFLYFSFFVTNTVMAQEIRFFQSYSVSDLYLIYVQNDFKKSNVCCFCYNSFLYKETVKHSIVCSYGLQSWCKSLYIK